MHFAFDVHFVARFFRDAGAIVGHGGRSLEKGTCTNYDIIITSEFIFKSSGGSRDCGACDRHYLGANEEYSSSYSPLKLFCIAVVLCIFLFKPRIQGRCEKSFAWGL